LGYLHQGALRRTLFFLLPTPAACVQYDPDEQLYAEKPQAENGSALGIR